MPTKYKIHYACTIYLLLWASGMFLLGLYFTVSEPGSNAAGPVLFLFILALVITKATTGLLVIKHYKKSTLPSKALRVIFIIGFGIICLVALTIVLLSVFLIIPEDFTRHRDDMYGGQRYDELLLDISFFIGGICAIYVAIFDLVLLNATQKQHEENLLSFELDNNADV